MTGEKIFIKEINSIFGNKELVEYLEKSADKELMIVGLQTNFCIDAETTYKYYNEMMWPKRFAECVSLEDAIGINYKMIVSRVYEK